MLFRLSATSCYAPDEKTKVKKILEKYPKVKRYKPQMQNGRFYIEIKDLTDLLQLLKDICGSYCEELIITKPYGVDENSPEVEIEIYDSYRE